MMSSNLILASDFKRVEKEYSQFCRVGDRAFILTALSSGTTKLQVRHPHYANVMIRLDVVSKGYRKDQPYWLLKDEKTGDMYGFC